MPATNLPAGHPRLLLIAGAFLFLACSSMRIAAVPRRAAPTLSAYEKAQRMREALEGRTERDRTRRDYDRVMDAYRAIYHSDPASSKADASIAAVADLLAEEGRIFQDEKSLHNAIGQYEFLRKQYPGSHYRFSALLTIGEIYLRDLNDRDNARATFQEFIKTYPKNPLANEAKLELNSLRHSKPGSATDPALPRFASNKHNASAPDQTQPSTTTALRNTPEPAPTALSATKAESRDKPAHGFEESDLPSPAAATPIATHAEPDTKQVSEATLNAPPPPRHGKRPLVTGIRYWSTPVYTRVAIDLQEEVKYEAVRVPNPDRIFFDLQGARLSPELIGKSDEVIDDGFLKQVRVAQFSNNVTRVVLDVSDVSDYSAFFLPNPSRLIIDVHGRKPRTVPTSVATTTPGARANPGPPKKKIEQTKTVADAKPQPEKTQPQPTPLPDAPAQISAGTETHAAANTTNRATTPASAPASAHDTNSAGTPSTLADVASLSTQPDRVKATKHPTTAPVAQSVAGTTPAPQPPAPQPDDLTAGNTTPPPPLPRTRSRHSQNSSTEAPPVDLGASGIHAAQPTATGQRSLVRALGLKINRIVVDAGHGGHDSGTLGPGGIEEKDVVLDVALRLGALLKQKLGADVIYTRDDDTFIPLETRTAIANKAQADLFISVHANSSSDASARGVETYYLNFTSSADALEVAARENAVSDQSIHQLSDLVKKITLQDKINESREFASDVEQSLYVGLEDGNSGLKDRGVKKAPFVVLIGANMPSILAEISFLTNPDDAHQLRNPQYRERIAESLYRGVSRYVGSLSGVRIADASVQGIR